MNRTTRKTCRKDMGVSKNRGTPKSSQFDRVFKPLFSPSILGVFMGIPSPYFWFNTPPSRTLAKSNLASKSRLAKGRQIASLGYGMDMGVEPKIGGWDFPPKMDGGL